MSPSEATKYTDIQNDNTPAACIQPDKEAIHLEYADFHNDISKT